MATTHDHHRETDVRFGLKRMLVGILLALAGTLHSAGHLSAQPSFLILPPDLTDYPVLSTGFYPMDQAGRRITGLTLADLQLLENDLPVEIDYLDCPAESNPAPISVVLGIDVSNSMEVVQSNRTLLSWVEEAARTFINDLPLNPSEVGTISFSDRPRQLFPMSTNHSALLGSVTGLKADGGTDFDRAFLDPAGGINSAAVGTNKKVLVLFTDGEGVESDREEIIRRANGAGVSVYIVVLGSYALPMLREIAERTGGLYINAFQQPERLNGIARMILAHSRLVEPCEVRWRATPGCNVDRRVVIRMPRLQLWGETSYMVPESVGQELEISSRGVRFGKVEVGADTSITVQLRARNDALTIIGYSTTLPSVTLPAFDLPGALPMVIERDSVLNLEVLYRSTGTEGSGGMIVIGSDACVPDTLFFSTGLESEIGSLPSIVLRVPNGGEVYSIGSTQQYEVEGGLPGNEYQFRTSTDVGETWVWSGSSPVSGGVDVVLPMVTSDSCLAEVWQDLVRDETVRLEHPADIVDHMFTGDSTTVATLANDGVVRWFDIESGFMFDSALVASASVRLTPIGGRRSVVVETKDEVLLLDPVAGTATRIATSLPLLDAPVRNVATLGAKDSRVASHRDLPILYGVRFELDTNSVVQALLYRHSLADSTTQTLATLGCYPRAIDLSDDGRYLAFGGADRCLEIRTGGFDAPGLELSDPFGDVVELQFDQTGEYLAVLSHDPISNGYSLTIRRAVSGEVIFSHRTISSLAASIDFERFNDGVILGERIPTVRDIVSGAVQKSLDRGVAGNGRARSHWARPLVATTTGDSGLLVWRLNQPYRHHDRSDSLWRLVAPDIRLTPVDFGEHLVGESVDSLVVGLVLNGGDEAVRVERLRIVGSDASDFEIVDPVTPFSVASGKTRNVLLRFTASAKGTRRAQLVADFGSITFETSLLGVGLLPGVELRGLVNRGLDYGAVTIGTSAVDRFTIANVGDRTLRLDSVTTTGPNEGEFAIDKSSILGVLEVGAEIAVPATFTPTLRGVRFARYLLYYSDTLSPGSPTGSPAPFLLYGTGINGPNEPAISYLPLDTFNSECLEVVFDTVRLTNIGSVSVEINEPYLRDGSSFDIGTGVYPVILNPGDSHEVSVAFRPSNYTATSDQLVISTTTDSIVFDLFGNVTGDRAELSGSIRSIEEHCATDSLFAVLSVRDLSGGSGEVSVTLSIATSGVVLAVPSVQVLRYESGQPGILSIAMYAPGIDRVEGAVSVDHLGCALGINLPLLVERPVSDLRINRVDSVCAGESVELSISGDGSIEWESDPLIGCIDCRSQQLQPLRSQWAFGVLTDPRGCSRRDSVWIEVAEPAAGRLRMPGEISGSAGDTIFMPLMISVDRPLTGVTGGLLTITFDGTSLQPILSAEDLFSGTLLEGWSILSIQREAGLIRLYLEGPAPLSRTGVLATISGALYLGEKRTTGITARFEPVGACAEIEPASTLLTLDSICGLDHRLIEIGLRPMRLHPVAPNPSTGAEVAIRIDLPFDRHLRVSVIDVEGRPVATIVDGMVESGAHSITFVSDRLADGTYVVRVESEGWNASQRFILAR